MVSWEDEVLLSEEGNVVWGAKGEEHELVCEDVHTNQHEMNVGLCLLSLT